MPDQKSKTVCNIDSKQSESPSTDLSCLTTDPTDRYKDIHRFPIEFWRWRPKPPINLIEHSLFWTSIWLKNSTHQFHILLRVVQGYETFQPQTVTQSRS